MPLRNVEEIQIRKTLMNISIMYLNTNYVANQLFPIIDGVDKKTKILEYKLAPWYRDEAGVRAEFGAAPVSRFSVTSQEFDPINFATGTEISDEQRRDAKIDGNLPVEPFIDAMLWMANKLDLKKEINAGALLRATNWATTGAGGEDAGGNWGHATAASDTFLEDTRKARNYIKNNTGFTPNKLFLDWYAREALYYAPALLALISPENFRPGMFVDDANLKTLTRVDQIIVGDAFKNTDEETVADTSSTLVNVWGTVGSETKGVAFLYYAPDVPKKKTPSAGYQYRLKQENGLVRTGQQWDDRKHHKVAMDLEEDTQIKATGLDLGYMFKNTATA